MNWCNKIY